MYERNALLLESWRNKSLVCSFALLSIFCYFIFSCFLLFFIITTMSCKYLFFANAISANMLYDPSIQLSEIWWPWPPSLTPCSKKWGVSWPRWPRASDSHWRNQFTCKPLIQSCFVFFLAFCYFLLWVPMLLLTWPNNMKNWFET